MDIFCFFNEEPYRLDSFQRCGMQEEVEIAHGKGARKLVIVPSRGSLMDRASIYSYSDLQQEELFSLENDSPLSPLWTAVSDLPSEGASLTLKLVPQLCEIRINSLAGDFSEREYESLTCRIEGFYLINAAVESYPLYPGGGYPVSWLNTGGRNSDNELVTAMFPVSLGKERIYPEVSLFTYPGSKDTKLVIEASFGPSVICYYPIELGEPEPGTRISFDITLLRMGTDDPTLPAKPGSFVFTNSVSPWIVKEDIKEVY